MDKQHILDEIRRTAAANAGTPLGLRRFLQATGIRQSDWLGIFWARWSDAVKEAGFVPNPYQAAYADDFLLEALATLSRELGRLPTYSEIRLKSRNADAFPSGRVFVARFKSKRRMAMRLQAYCKERPAYADVAGFCDSVVGDREHDAARPQADAPAAGKAAAIGFVYLMKSGRYYKVGYSNAAGRRAYELAIQLPDRLETVHVIRTDDPPGIEHYWHARFAAKRMNGEWFSLTGEDVRAFKRRKFM